MRYARIYPWRRTRRFRAPSNGPEAFFVAQFSAGYTTNMFGFDLRHGQVGILVLALGASEFLDLRRWEEGLEAACGLLLIASPFLLGYPDAGMLRYWHFVLGAAVVLLAMLELRQDWTLSNAELTRHSAR